VDVATYVSELREVLSGNLLDNLVVVEGSSNSPAVNTYTPVAVKELYTVEANTACATATTTTLAAQNTCSECLTMALEEPASTSLYRGTQMLLPFSLVLPCLGNGKRCLVSVGVVVVVDGLFVRKGLGLVVVLVRGHRGQGGRSLHFPSSGLWAVPNPLL